MMEKQAICWTRDSPVLNLPYPMFILMVITNCAVLSLIEGRDGRVGRGSASIKSYWPSKGHAKFSITIGRRSAEYTLAYYSLLLKCRPQRAWFSRRFYYRRSSRSSARDVGALVEYVTISGSWG